MSPALLKLIFSLKGNFAEGFRPPLKVASGVAVAPFLQDRFAAVSISADFELNWAWRESAPAERDMKGRLERRNLPELLTLLERTRVPVTWATVGHMFLASCSRGADGRAHPDMPRPTRNDRWSGDWYAHDPCTNVATDPLWYSPDLIQQLLASEVPHEIGTHSFSHIDFSESHSTAQLVEWELRACIDAMASFGIQPRSLVYPFNQMGHSYLDLLARLGVTAVRHRDRRIRLSYPERTPSGVYKLYETLNLRKPGHYDYTQKAALFIDEAMRRRAAFHIWFHPSDPPEVFRDVFTPIVEDVACRRDAGSVWTTTMSSLAAYCEAREATQLAVSRNGTEMRVSLDCTSYDVDRFGRTNLTLIIPCSHSPRSAVVTDARVTRQIETPPAVASGPGAVMATIPASDSSLHLVF